MVYRNLGLHDYETHHWKNIRLLVMSGVRVETTKQRPAQKVNQHTVTTNRPQALRDESPWAAAKILWIQIQGFSFTKTGTEIYCNSSWLAFCRFCFCTLYLPFLLGRVLPVMSQYLISPVASRRRRNVPATRFKMSSIAAQTQRGENFLTVFGSRDTANKASAAAVSTHTVACLPMVVCI